MGLHNASFGAKVRYLRYTKASSFQMFRLTSCLNHQNRVMTPTLGGPTVDIKARCFFKVLHGSWERKDINQNESLIESEGKKQKCCDLRPVTVSIFTIGKLVQHSRGRHR